jgi:hypothetical protein
MTLDVVASPMSSRRHQGRPAHRAQFVTWGIQVLLLALMFKTMHSLGKILQDREGSVYTNYPAISSICPTTTETMITTATITSTIAVETSCQPWSSSGTVSKSRSTSSTLPSVSEVPTPLPIPASAAFVPEPTTVSSPRSKSSSADDETSLLPAYALPWPWPLRFDFDISIPPLARKTAQSIFDQMLTVWQVMRTVYHYPLPPP